MDLHVKVVGIEALNETFRRLANDALVNAPMMVRSVGPIRDAMARNMARSSTPHGPSPGGGRRRPIGASHAADHVVISPGKSGYSVAVGPAQLWWYWMYQEFGTSRHPAQPALRPAFDAHAGQASSTLVNEISEMIERKIVR